MVLTTIMSLFQTNASATGDNATILLYSRAVLTKTHRLDCHDLFDVVGYEINISCMILRYMPLI
jgi:hypothetical protein